LGKIIEFGIDITSVGTSKPMLYLSLWVLEKKLS